MSSPRRGRHRPGILRATARFERPALLALLLGVVLCLPQAGQLPANAAPACSLAPQLRDFTINQGVGTYAVLTRGKETEVRLFISKPTCAAKNQAMSLTGATLTMNIPGSPSKTYPTLNPVSSSSPAPLTAYTGAPAPDAAGDPKFVIPGTDLVSADPSTRFTATFTATLNVTTSTTPTTISAISGGGAAMSATVEQRTKALRILVVPMGAALTSVDSSVLQAGLNNLSRMLPVPKTGGQLTGPLTSSSSVGGIRYAINSGVLSVPRDASGRFCGNLNSFDAVKGQLAQYRNDWNAANSANPSNPDANPTADIVLGVVSSDQSSSGSAGCAEGMASPNSPEAWVRLVPGTSTPSTAGTLMAMEIAHTFGAEGPGTTANPWADPLNPTHSKYTEADAGTNRAYNITTRSFLADDRTVMRSQTTGWHQDSTVYEKRDYEFLTCRLGGRPNADCLTTGTVGTVSGVGAGPTFLMSGTTDNTAAGTHIVESYGGPPAAFTTPPATSRYTLQFLRGTTVTTQTKVAVVFGESEHIGQQAPDHTSPIGLISLAVPFPLDADRNNIRLVYQPPTGNPVVLFGSTQNGQPTLEQLSVDSSSGGDGDAFVNYTNTAAFDERDPALSPDGQWIAWISDVDGPALTVASTSDPNQRATFFGAPYPRHPAWRPDGSAIVFAAEDGSLYRVPVTTSGSSPQIGSAVRIFDGSTSLQIQADNPSYSPDGAQIAFDDGEGQLYTMNSVGGHVPLPLITDDSEGFDPSWSQTPGDDRIAFSGHDENMDAQGIIAIASNGSGVTNVLTDNWETEPSWGTDGVIAYNADGTLRTLDSAVDYDVTTGPTPPADPPAIDGQYGSQPSYVRRGLSAFQDEFPTPPTGWQTDIMLEQSAAAGVAVTAAGGIVGGNTDQASLENLRLTLYYQCPGSPERSVLGLALEPTGFTGVGTPDAQALFDQTFDESQLCGGSGGGTVTGVLSDFFGSAPFPGQPGFNPLIQNQTVGNSAQGPVASIVDPVQDATFLEWQSIALQGEGIDGRLRQVADVYLSWSIDGGTALGSTVDYHPLPVGDYPVTLTVTDPDTGLMNVTSTTIHVVGDQDHDGLPDTFENSQGCFPSGAASNGDSINLDSDGDGIPDGQDLTPCVPTPSGQLFHPEMKFTPTTLNTSAQGNYVNVAIEREHGTPDLTSVVPGSVSITSIKGIPLSGPSAPIAFAVTDELFSPNVGWKVTTGKKEQVGTATFDRQLLGAYIKKTFKPNQKLTLTVSGFSSVPAWTFNGTGNTTIKKG